MVPKRERELSIWLVVVAIVIALTVLVSDILLPFVVGMGVAYFLDPVADKLEKYGFSRTLATVIITIVFFLSITMVILLIYPMLQNQFLGFFAKLPHLVKSLETWISPLKNQVIELFPPENFSQLSEATKSQGATLVGWFGGLLKGVLKGGLAFFNALSLVIITPVVIFYFLRDWDKIVSKFFNYLPRNSVPSVTQILKDIDVMLAGFVRGQGTVCLFLAIFYGLTLTFIGLDFGLLVGIITGLISFIPYFGALIGLTLALTIAITQSGEWLFVLLTLFVFGFGQAVESMLLTPKLVGDKVGLHAVWIIFALMCGGSVAGFTGVLLAVPAAATIGVLLRFALTKYLASELYKDGSDGDEAP